MEQKELLSLLVRVRNGDNEAFALLMSQFCGMTAGLVGTFSVGLCEADRAELSQEASCALYRAACSYRDSVSVTFGLYARICVRNALISFLRRRTALECVSFCELDELLPSDEQGPLDSLMAVERLAELSEKIAEELSAYEQSVFALMVEGEENGRIAELLGESKKSVANAVFRIRSKLRALLGK